MKLTEKEMRKRGFLKYEELSETAAKEAYNRFAWDFVNNQPNDWPHERIIKRLNGCWFDKDGATFLGTY